MEKGYKFQNVSTTIAIINFIKLTSSQEKSFLACQSHQPRDVLRMFVETSFRYKVLFFGLIRAFNDGREGDDWIVLPFLK